MTISNSRRRFGRLVSLSALGLALTATAALAQPQWHSKVLAQKSVKTLASGSLYWQVQNFSSPAAAKAAARSTSLEVEVGGSAWLFTLAPKGDTVPGGATFAEIGPVKQAHAAPRVLRVAIAGGPHGATMPVHKQAGSEAFYVMTGQLSAKTQSGVTQAGTGKSLVAASSHGAVQVSSTGKQDLNAFVLSVARPTATAIAK